jgi:hypothetical protein
MFRTFKIAFPTQDKNIGKQLRQSPVAGYFALPSMSLIVLRYAVLTFHIVEIFNYNRSNCSGGDGGRWVAKLVAPAYYDSSLGSNQDIYQKYKISDTRKGMANPL